MRTKKGLGTFGDDTVAWIALDKHEDEDTGAAVFVIRLLTKEARFNPMSIKAWNDALDIVEAHEGPAALVTSSDGKIYSNGLDLNWMMKDPAQRGKFVARDFEPLLGRMLNLGMPTVAAVNGHAFAGGFMIALTHDYIVARGDRGFFCLNEIEIGFAFLPGLEALIEAKLGIHGWAVFRDALLGAARFTAQAGADAGFVDAIVPKGGSGETLDKAIALAFEKAPKGNGNRSVYTAIRRVKVGKAADVLTAGPSRL